MKDYFDKWVDSKYNDLKVIDANYAESFTLDNDGKFFHTEKLPAFKAAIRRLAPRQ